MKVKVNKEMIKECLRLEEDNWVSPDFRWYREIGPELRETLCYCGHTWHVHNYTEIDKKTECNECKCSSFGQISFEQFVSDIEAEGGMGEGV